MGPSWKLSTCWLTPKEGGGLITGWNRVNSHPPPHRGAAEGFKICLHRAFSALSRSKAYYIDLFFSLPSEEMWWWVEIEDVVL